MRNYETVSKAPALLCIPITNIGSQTSQILTTLVRATLMGEKYYLIMVLNFLNDWWYWTFFMCLLGFFLSFWILFLFLNWVAFLFVCLFLFLFLFLPPAWHVKVHGQASRHLTHIIVGSQAAAELMLNP